MIKFRFRIASLNRRPDLRKEFNSGKYARKDYKRLYQVSMTQNGMSSYIATPDFRQILYSVRTLWNAKEGKPYDRHNHPVKLINLGTPKTAAQAKDIDAREKILAAKSARRYSRNKHNRKSHKRNKK